MQIIRWLIKVAYEPSEESETRSNCKGCVSDKKPISKDVVLFNTQGTGKGRRRVEESKLRCDDFNIFRLLCRRDIAKDCFYSTINLKQLESSHRRQHWIQQAMKMQKESPVHGLISNVDNQKAESAGHVGNTKVLPITDSAAASGSMKNNNNSNNNNNNNNNDNNNSNQRVSVDKNDKVRSDKTKTISRMKELLRWAAAAKSEKGGKFLGRKVLQFRNRARLKAVPDDDQLSSESPKISFRWDLESCSTSSSVYSAISSLTKNDQAINMLSVNSTPAHDNDQCVTRRGNWITSDSEFVVLEL